MNMEMLEVLNKGYVRLVDSLGSDLSVVNSARVSYNKEVNELSARDMSLINFLAREGHTSPFRHGMLQFEVYAPLMVARQWWKYVIGGAHQQDAWNESSRRYITEQAEFYIPDVWRSAPENSKQGSGASVNLAITAEATGRQLRHIKESLEHYDWALDNGICAEQARLFLPAYGVYVRWYWTASLQSVAHFLNQRLADDAQVEIQEYAKVVKELAEQHFPNALDKLTQGEKVHG